MASTPWLSVVLPTWQGERFLGEALASLEAQRDPGVFEVLAVDDGSTDGTLGMLEAAASRLPLRILTPPRAGNWVRGTNLGLAAARGTYACILHQDDVWAPDRMGLMRGLVAARPDGVLFTHPCRYIGADGRDLGRLRPPLPAGDVTGILKPRLLVQNFLAVAAVVFRRDASLVAGCLDEGLWYTADWDLWLKLAGVGRAYHHPGFLASFRIHGTAQTILGSRDPADFRLQLERVLARHKDGMPSEALREARFSLEANLALAAMAHGRPAGLASLLVRFLELGPAGWYRYFRDSRVIERVLARRSLLGAMQGSRRSPGAAAPAGASERAA